MSQAAAYEVRCPNCQTSFAPETKRCVHCGGPLGRGRILASVPAQHGIQVQGPHGQVEDEEDFELATRARNRLWVVMAVMAVIASVARTCGGGPG